MNSSFPSASSPSAPTLRRTKAQARGFSLLEVAIALVIFVFGALAIVRIFPGALRVITVGGSRQIALNLNRATMARVQLNPPAATYDVGPTGTGWQDGYLGDPSANPPIPSGPRAVLGSTNRGYSLPRTSNLQDYDKSALGSIRGIVGEGETVNATDEVNPKLFILTQFPVYDIDGSYAVALVEKGRLNGVTINADGNLDFANATWADSNAPFSPVGSENFDVSFRYQRNANVWGVTDYPATVTTTGITTNTVTTAKIPPPFGTTSPAIYPIVVGQVEVTCKNNLGSPFATTPSENDLERGFISVDLSTLNKMQGSGTPTVLAPGDKIFVDYQADWSRMLQEGIADTVPERSTPTTTRQMALGAPFIEDNAPNTILTLSYKKDAATAGRYVGIKGCWGEGGFGVDNDNSLTTTTSAYTRDLPKLLSPINTDPNVRTPKADLRASRVTFDLGNSQGFTSRVSYRTSDQWSQQLSVAADSYKPFVGNPSVQPWRDYDLAQGILFFHASDAGKSVMVTYTYKLNPSDPNSPKITLRNRLLSVGDNPEQGNVAGLTPGFSDATRYVARLPLTDADGNELAASQLLSISSVRGASVTVRTAWLDGNHYTQSFLTAITGGEAMP